MIERERKYALTKEDYLRLRSKYPQEEILQTNFYFTFEQNDGFMVRIRLKKDNFEMTVKTGKKGLNGLFVSDELNADISKDEADFFLKNGISKQKIKEYLGIDIPFDVQYVGKLDTYRTKFYFKDIVLELDKNLYGTTTDFELECELSKDKENTLKEFLEENFPVLPPPSALPKFKRWQNSLN